MDVMEIEDHTDAYNTHSKISSKDIFQNVFTNYGFLFGERLTSVKTSDVRGPNDFDSPSNSHDISAKAYELWSKKVFLTESLAVRLCEQLRFILEPTLANRLQGTRKKYLL
jgi:hypothetical protein